MENAASGTTLWSYTATRVAQVVPVVLVLLVFNFGVVHLAPGDPVSLLVGDASSPEIIEQVRREFGLDRTLPEQFVIYAGRLARGDLGYSYRYRTPVGTMILERLPDTLFLMGVAFAISFAIGVTFGVLAAQRPGSVLDTVMSVGALVGYSLPVFWIGMLLILFFAFQLGWLPLQGTHTVGMKGSILDHLVDRLRHVILPSLTLSVTQLAVIFRLTRSRMIEELRKDYVAYARAKGLSELQVRFKHALRNVALTLVTIATLRLGVMFSGAVLTEVVFAWPGIGRLTYAAMLSRDYPVVLGVFTIVVAVTIVSNILADVSYALLDPRVRHG
jgi:peptide/nickel transport system permease protein